MDSPTIIAALKELKVPHERIADAIKRDRTAATKMLGGSRSVKFSEAAALEALIAEYRAKAPAPVAEPSPIAVGLGARESLNDASLLHIRGEVRAGAWLEENLLDQREPTTYPAAPDPRYPRDAQWLSRVRGDSMNALMKEGKPAGILDGDLVHLLDVIPIGYEPATGDVVEVERSRYDGRETEITLKQVEVTTEGAVLLWPRSTNPAWQEPIPYRDGDAAHISVRIRAKMLQVLRPFA